jgi:hypothetical protein
MASESPYQTIIPLVGSLPSWVTDKEDQERLASYDVYDDMFHNNPDTYALVLRGTDDQPVLIPTAKSVINNMSRYVGRGFGFAVPRDKGTEAEQILAIQTYGELFKREEILSKFKIGIKEKLRRGDLFWYIQGDTSKPLGSRISITTLDPRTVFKITDESDSNRVTGYKVVEQLQIGDKIAVKKQTWLKNTNPDHPSYGNPEAPVVYDCVTIEADGWDGDNPKIIQKVVPQMYLPREVIQLPIYHMKNDAESNYPYGSSVLRGLERTIAAINQGVSDEDIALAMAGLGMYKSSSAGPVGDDGQSESDWIIGPGRVVEDDSFERVDGVKSVSPSQDHIKYLENSIDGTVGVTSVTRGEVTAQVAESGVALAIRMAPTIDMAEEKDLHVKDIMDHILYDLKAWFKALEGIDLTNVDIITSFGDKMPRNRDAEMKELFQLLEAKVISVEYFQFLLQEKFGYVLPKNIMEQIAEDTARNAPADPYGDFSQTGGDPNADPNADPQADPSVVA